DADPRVVTAALYALAHLQRGGPSELAALTSHASADVRAALAYALGRRGDPVSLATLITLSRDEDKDTRDWATFGLGSLCDVATPQIRDALAARLGDSDEEVRGEAMLGLAKRRDERAVAAILRELSNDDVLTLAVEAAAAWPRAEFLPDLEQLFAAQPD